MLLSLNRLLEVRIRNHEPLAHRCIYAHVDRTALVAYGSRQAQTPLMTAEAMEIFDSQELWIKV